MCTKFATPHRAVLSCTFESSVLCVVLVQLLGLCVVLVLLLGLCVVLVLLLGLCVVFVPHQSRSPMESLESHGVGSRESQESGVARLAADKPAVCQVCQVCLVWVLVGLTSIDY